MTYEMKFDPCRTGRHWECDPHFSIPTNKQDQLFVANCNCDCHKADAELERLKAEKELNGAESDPTIEQPALELPDTTWDVDLISIDSQESLFALAQEASEMFGFDKDFFVAAVWVADRALRPDGAGSFPHWKAYEEAKRQIVEGSKGCITLCTGRIKEGLCEVCEGTPGVEFTDTPSELGVHILSDAYGEEEPF